MKMIICVDDDYGLSFHHRRQSRDAVVMEDMVKLVQKNDAELWVKPYSASLFDDVVSEAAVVQVDENCTVCCGQDDYCFLELEVSMTELANASELVLYRWNRKYPSDMGISSYAAKLHEDGQYRLVQSQEFSGKSHERITREIYVKNLI